jgi:hypothetical protein
MMKLGLLAVLCVLSAGAAFGGNNDYYYKHWCGTTGTHQYLNDANRVKAFPSSYDREWTCPVPPVVVTPANLEALLSAGYAVDQPLSTVTVDTVALGKYVTNGAHVCVVLTKRVLEAGVTQLYNKYFCAGNSSATEIYETWSSSKIFAMANAGGHLRTNESACDSLLFGLDSSTTGKHGSTLLGDLATIVCSYDRTAGYTSNSLSSYFHDMVSETQAIITVAGSDGSSAWCISRYNIFVGLARQS